jgi:hypothetical protein
MPLLKSKKVGDIMEFGEPFYILYNNINLVIFENNHLITKYINVKNAIENKINFQFRLRCRMMRYYCNNNKVMTVPDSEIINVGDTGIYNNKIVMRNSKCYGICDYFNNTEQIIQYSTHPPLKLFKKIPKKTLYKILTIMLIILITFSVLIIITIISIYMFKNKTRQLKIYQKR